MGFMSGNKGRWWLFRHVGRRALREKLPDGADGLGGHPHEPSRPIASTPCRREAESGLDALPYLQPPPIPTAVIRTHTLRTLATEGASRRGSAMVVGLFMTTIVSFMILVFLTTAVDSSKWTAHEADAYHMEAVAESAVAAAVHQIWGAFESQQANQVTTPFDFRGYLDNLGIPDQRGVASPATVDALGMAGLATDSAGGDGLDRLRIDRLDVHRLDVVQGTRLVFDVTVGMQVGGQVRRHSIRESFLIERSEWEGLDYAMLANNINCILCHASIDTADRYYNNNPSLYGTFERVKVGSLESLQLRNSVDSWIAGTLYLKGRAYTGSGDAITNWPSRDFKSRTFDGEGHLQEDGFGDALSADFQPADSTSPQPNKNLYLDYDEDTTPLVDGFMPQNFPAVFPDDGGVDPLTGMAADPTAAGNRIVDASEFAATTVNAAGSLSGGVIHLADPNDVIDTSSEVTAAETTGNVANLGATTDGNLILRGTQANPLLLNGEVAIHGDIVLDGWVKGSGTLLVSGNVYIPNDLQYADGTDGLGNRTYGNADDGTENALAIASGGNIMLGNIFHPRWGNGATTGNPDGSFSFILDELAIFNRSEWTKTQPVLPGQSEDIDNPLTWTVANPLFEGPDYLPRYYQFTDDATVPIFKDGYFDATTESWKGREHPGRWDTDRLMYAAPGDPADPVLYASDGTPRAVVTQLTANDTWITDAMLEGMMKGRLATRDEDDPLHIDAVLYSNNSIFGIIPRASRAAGLDGRLILSGAIVAADLGLLSPTQIQIRYDPRGKALIDIPSDTQLTIRRELWAPLALQ